MLSWLSSASRWENMLGLVEHLFITEQPGLINHSAVNITAEMKSCIDGLREGKKKSQTESR